MKHRYMILKNDEENNILIQEFAELDKDLMTLVCEENYQIKSIKTGALKGPDALISVLRTPNFYPAGVYAKKIAESLIDFFQTKSTEPIEIVFDDTEYLPKESINYSSEEEPESDSDDIDDLIEDEFDEEFDDKDTIKKIDSAIKVAEDDYEDFDEEN